MAKKKPRPSERSDSDDACPYCGKVSACPHLLLLLDLTFGEAQGGKYYDEYEAALGEIDEALQQLDSGGDEDSDAGTDDEPDWDTQEWLDAYRDGGVPQKFCEFIASEMSSISSLDRQYEFEGGPGQSSNMHAFWTDQPRKATKSAFRDLLVGLPFP
jgi:hypothetical protein